MSQKIIVQFQRTIAGYNAGDIAGLSPDRAADLLEKGLVSRLAEVQTSDAARYTPVESAVRDAPFYPEDAGPPENVSAEEPRPVSEDPGSLDYLPPNWESLTWARRRAIAIRLGASREIAGNSVDAYLRRKAAEREG